MLVHFVIKYRWINYICNRLHLELFFQLINYWYKAIFRVTYVSDSFFWITATNNLTSLVRDFVFYIKYFSNLYIIHAQDILQMSTINRSMNFHWRSTKSQPNVSLSIWNVLANVSLKATFFDTILPWNQGRCNHISHLTTSWTADTNPRLPPWNGTDCMDLLCFRVIGQSKASMLTNCTSFVWSQRDWLSVGAQAIGPCFILVSISRIFLVAHSYCAVENGSEKCAKMH